MYTEHISTGDQTTQRRVPPASLFGQAGDFGIPSGRHHGAEGGESGDWLENQPEDQFPVWLPLSLSVVPCQVTTWPKLQFSCRYSGGGKTRLEEAEAKQAFYPSTCFYLV